IADPSPLLEYSAWGDGPATITATINTSGKRAGAIAKPLALGLSEIEMITTARRLRGRTSRHWIVTTEGFEVCNAVSAARMAVKVHYEEATAPQLNAGDCVGEGDPPLLDLLGIAGCGLAPS